MWLMRQAGRYMAEFRACALRDMRVAAAHPHPSYSDKIPFRQRSETPEIAIELSLQARVLQQPGGLAAAHAADDAAAQPWRAFQPDGVIMFSDILTPLPALGCALAQQPLSPADSPLCPPASSSTLSRERGPSSRTASAPCSRCKRCARWRYVPRCQGVPSAALNLARAQDPNVSLPFVRPVLEALRCGSSFI